MSIEKKVYWAEGWRAHIDPNYNVCYVCRKRKPGWVPATYHPHFCWGCWEVKKEERRVELKKSTSNVPTTF